MEKQKLKKHSSSIRANGDIKILPCLVELPKVPGSVESPAGEVEFVVTVRGVVLMVVILVVIAATRVR